MAAQAPLVIVTIGFAFAGLSLLGTAVNAGADASTGLPPVGNVAGYPAPLPDGCPEGAGALLGTTFGIGAGSTHDDLAELTLRAGDTLTMRWDRFAPGCLDASGQPAIAVTLAAHRMAGERFDPGVDQPLAAWSSCGADAAACGGDGGSNVLRLAVPSAAVGCRFQVDAILGRPLAVVGPGGSFYSAVLRGNGPSMLIGAVGVDIPGCATTPTTVPTTATTTVPTTAPPVTIAPTTTLAPIPPSPPITLAPQVQGVSQVGAALPATGRSTGGLTRSAAGLVAGGFACLAVARAAARRLALPGREG